MKTAVLLLFGFSAFASDQLRPDQLAYNRALLQQEKDQAPARLEKALASGMIGVSTSLCSAPVPVLYKRAVNLAKDVCSSPQQHAIKFNINIDGYTAELLKGTSVKTEIQDLQVRAMHLHNDMTTNECVDVRIECKVLPKDRDI